MEKIRKSQDQDRISRLIDRVAALGGRSQNQDKIQQLNQAMQKVTIRPPTTTRGKP